MDNKYVFLLGNNRGFFFTDGNKFYFPSRNFKNPQVGIARVDKVVDKGNYAFIDGEHIETDIEDWKEVSRDKITELVKGSRKADGRIIKDNPLLIINRKYKDDYNNFVYRDYYAAIDGEVYNVLHTVNSGYEVSNDKYMRITRLMKLQTSDPILREDEYFPELCPTLRRIIAHSYFEYINNTKYDLSILNISKEIIYQLICDTDVISLNDIISCTIYDNGIITMNKGHFTLTYAYDLDKDRNITVSDIPIDLIAISEEWMRNSLYSTNKKVYKSDSIIDILMSNYIIGDRWLHITRDIEFISDALHEINDNLDINSYPSLVTISVYSTELGLDTKVIAQDRSENTVLDDNVIIEVAGRSFEKLKDKIRAMKINTKNKVALDAVCKLSKDRLLGYN